MNKLKAFVRLDFITIKPYFTVKNLMIYGIVALFLIISSSGPASSIGVGFIIAMGSMFVGYPFALGEKNGMDTLYATLSLSRKNVVLGRYLFTLTLNLCTVLLSLVLAVIGILVTRTSGFIETAVETLLASIVFAAMFLVIQAVQLPLYFKLGYSKAKFFSMIPFVVVMAGFGVFYSLAEDSEAFNRVFGFFNTMNSFWFIACVVLALLLVVFASYSLSLSFYRKREF
jgi:hypothetical protein